MRSVLILVAVPAFAVSAATAQSPSLPTGTTLRVELLSGRGQIAGGLTNLNRDILSLANAMRGSRDIGDTVIRLWDIRRIEQRYTSTHKTAYGFLGFAAGLLGGGILAGTPCSGGTCLGRPIYGGLIGMGVGILAGSVPSNGWMTVPDAALPAQPFHYGDEVRLRTRSDSSAVHGRVVALAGDVLSVKGDNSVTTNISLSDAVGLERRERVGARMRIGAISGALAALVYGLTTKEKCIDPCDRTARNIRNSALGSFAGIAIGSKFTARRWVPLTN